LPKNAVGLGRERSQQREFLSAPGVAAVRGRRVDAALTRATE
jgi:hypothetical protein